MTLCKYQYNSTWKRPQKYKIEENSMKEEQTTTDIQRKVFLSIEETLQTSSRLQGRN